MRRTAFVNRVHLGPARAIPSQPICDKLEQAMPYIPLGSQNFARSLIQNHSTYGGWTPKQAEHADLLLERAREAYKERNGARATVAERVRVSDDGMRGIARMFRMGAKAIKAVGFVLKPARDEGYTISHDGKYCGNLRITGVVDVRAAHKERHAALVDRLDEMGVGYLLHNQDLD